MPYFARRSYRSGGRWPYRSWRSGSRAASVAGTRRFNVCVPVQDAFTTVVNSGSFFSLVGAVSPYYNAKNPSSGTAITCRGSMVSSLLYRTYSQLYDQVKINGVSIDFSFMTVIGAGGVVPAVKFFTSWDRSANYDEIVGRNGVPDVTSIQVGSESQAALLTNTSSMVVRRYIRASDLIERSRFHDCTVGENSDAYFDTMYAYGEGHTDVGFCPACFFCVNTAGSPAQGQQYVFNISVNVKWYVTFRNPKFGLASGGDTKGSFSLVPSSGVKSVVGGGMEDEKKEEKYEEEVVPDDDDLEDSQVPITDMSHDELVELVSQLRKNKS